MGFAAVQAFDATLNNHRKSVHGHFQMLLASGDSEDRQTKTEDRLDGIWQNPVDDRQTRRHACRSWAMIIRMKCCSCWVI